MIDTGAEKMISVPDGADAETLMKVLGKVFYVFKSDVPL